MNKKNLLIYLTWMLVTAMLCSLLPAVQAKQTRQTPKAHSPSARLDSLRRALAAVSEESNARVNILNELSQAYQYTSSDSSLMFADLARGIAERIGNDSGKAWALYHRNYALYSQGKYDVAMETLVQALPMFERLRDSNGLAHTLNDIGNIYKRREHYSDALGYFNRALTVYERIGNAEGSVLELCNMGATWRMQGDYEQSFAKSTEALRRAEAIGYKYGTVFASTNLGQYWAYWGKYDSAMAYFERALTTSEAIRSDKYTGQLYCLIGGLYAKQKDFARAVENTTRGVEIAKNARFAERVKDGYQTFVEIYTAVRDFQTALQYHHLYTNLKDSLFSVEVQDNISALQTKIATEQKENEIQLLRKEQQIESLIRNSLIGGVALLLLLFGVAASRYVIKQKAARELRETNARLADANAEITRQMDIQAEQAREIELANASLQELNTTLEHKNVQLVELDTEKNEFLGIAAHDLKNPLSGIRSLAEMMLDDAYELDTEQRTTFLTSIVNSSNRMFELLRNLLDVNAIERGGYSLSIVAFDIATQAQFTVENYRSRAALKDISLHFALTSDTAPMVVKADEQATQQILDNLVSNAVKYSPSGKQVFVRAARNESTVRVEVRDEGPGLSEADKAQLFGKFARLSAQPTGGEHSTGLGLSIVKKLVEAMNGRVWCESELGQGATFVVELPEQKSTFTI